MKKEYELYLRIDTGMDIELLKLVTEYLKTFHLFKDSKARIVNYDEYMALVESKKIDPPESYREISAGKYGIVHESYYNKFSTTWDLIVTAYGDFCSGYRAHKKKVT